MSTLTVPGAELHYDLVGEGPLILFIAGANGTGEIFKRLAGQLAPTFSVITYDRRGFGQSKLVGEQDYSVRLATDAADVAALIANAGKGPATVFGSSSGGVVALQFATDHPKSYSQVLVHEPAAMRVLPHAEEHLAVTDELYAAFHSGDPQAAMGRFIGKMMAPSDQATLMASAAHGDPAVMARGRQYWVEHELRQYPRTDFNFDALTHEAARLTFVTGEDCKGLPPYDIAVAFARKIGSDVAVAPGGHVGYATYPEAYAKTLAALLS